MLRKWQEIWLPAVYLFQFLLPLFFSLSVPHFSPLSVRSHVFQARLNLNKWCCLAFLTKLGLLYNTVLQLDIFSQFVGIFWHLSIWILVNVQQSPKHLPGVPFYLLSPWAGTSVVSSQCAIPNEPAEHFFHALLFARGDSACCRTRTQKWSFWRKVDWTFAILKELPVLPSKNDQLGHLSRAQGSFILPAPSRSCSIAGLWFVFCELYAPTLSL